MCELYQHGVDCPGRHPNGTVQTCQESLVNGAIAIELEYIYSSYQCNVMWNIITSKQPQTSQQPKIMYIVVSMGRVSTANPTKKTYHMAQACIGLQKLPN